MRKRVRCNVDKVWKGKHSSTVYPENSPRRGIWKGKIFGTGEERIAGPGVKKERSSDHIGGVGRIGHLSKKEKTGDLRTGLVGGGGRVGNALKHSLDAGKELIRGERTRKEERGDIID